MKFFFTIGFLMLTNSFFAQEITPKDENITIDANVFKGNILLHSPDIAHLITGHPEGVLLSISKKTFGSQDWQSAFNYPDYGLFLLYQDFKNPYLGKNWSVGVHYNFYFWKRQLQFKLAQGLAYTTNPYNKEFNNKNGAFGSELLGNTNFGLQYKKENIIDKIGLQAGFLFTHFSNGRIKSPNKGLNVFNISLGINYNFGQDQKYLKDTLIISKNYRQPIHYNLVLRTGANESPIANSGQYPFYHIGFYADKRLNRKSTVQFGAELFLTNSFKSFIEYQSEAYPRFNLDANTDYKRAGIFIGHEFIINHLSLEAQLGYYVYQPYKYNIPVYDRVGAKYYITPKIFTGLSVKTHGFLAEAMEFSIGTRF